MEQKSNLRKIVEFISRHGYVVILLMIISPIAVFGAVFLHKQIEIVSEIAGADMEVYDFTTRENRTDILGVINLGTVFQNETYFRKFAIRNTGSRIIEVDAIIENDYFPDVIIELIPSNFTFPLTMIPEDEVETVVKIIVSENATLGISKQIIDFTYRTLGSDE